MQDYIDKKQVEAILKDAQNEVNMHCLKPRDTAYIALFTCATTRALHIEIVSDLTTDKFLLALQRFIGRRGLPNTIYTDNSTTFHAANKELILLWQTLSSAKTQQYYAQNGITWHFIAPRAAWWEGWWKCLIGIVKQCLRKVLGRALLDEESLSTVLIGIEATLNSRPLVYEEESDDNSATLTPAHFLTGRKLKASQSRLENTRLNKIYKQQQDLLYFFWKKWSKKYL
ncbi:integrase catalytic domain-containing protein [Trichonephila clavata]|uniref:Integrase catalytic domain-containing protein n=1 Tax=Trichonephila clavata TaxID=2740835 RepID=A0A8X6HJI4_TRICU|nr:integrase catalytic domain-containing protein [Trichonephila clavata]